MIDLFLFWRLMPPFQPEVLALAGPNVNLHVFGEEQTPERRLAFAQERHRAHPERLVIWADPCLRDLDEAWAWADLRGGDVDLFAVDPERGLTAEQIQIIRNLIFRRLLHPVRKRPDHVKG